MDIVIKDFSLAFEKKTFIKNLNTIFEAGKITCLLGPSGIGKSSLLRAIAKLYTRDDSVELSGTITSDAPAYMAQTDLLLPWLTVLDNALLGSKLRGKISEDEKQKAIALLTEVGLGENLKDYPSTLSGGMRQRVALVRTFLEDKSVVLMDEPFSALDAITRLKLQDIAAKLLKGKTVLLVTHDPLEALRLADTIYVLSGLPAQLGEPIIPHGVAPRSTTEPEVLLLQGKLLKQLEGL
jgi:putative hydroxymethylpyrimidine transport system ATP-binding protein